MNAYRHRHACIKFNWRAYNLAIYTEFAKLKTSPKFLAIRYNNNNMLLMIVCSGSQVVIVVKLEREDEEEGSPHVIAPFFPQVRSLSDHLSQGSYNNTRVAPYKFKGMLSYCSVFVSTSNACLSTSKKYENHFVEGLRVYQLFFHH